MLPPAVLPSTNLKGEVVVRQGSVNGVIGGGSGQTVVS